MKQAGFTLVEIVVAMAIGMLVVGTVLSAYLSSSHVQVVQSAQAQMDEDAQIALRVLSSELMLAGYSEPTGLLPDGSAFQRVPVANPLHECGSGISSAGVCANTPGTQFGPTSLVVSYQATKTNTLLSGGMATDCLGNSLGAAALTANRYFPSVSSGQASLQCLGSSVGTDGNLRPSAPLVSNIEGLRFWYGQASASGSRQVVRHVTAAQLAGTSGPGAASPFDGVVSVRVCVLVRSVEPVAALEGVPLPGYLDCDQNPQFSADRRLRRAYFTTVALRNRMPF